jgi:hypothetical protein
MSCTRSQRFTDNPCSLSARLTVVTVFHHLLESVVGATATGMTTYAASTDGPVREREFQAVFVSALESALSQVTDAVRAKPNFGIKLEEWPGVGPVDVAVVSGGDPTVFFELKWGHGTLHNCVWDLEKLATAVATRTDVAAFLLAGAPPADWATTLGGELFETRDCELYAPHEFANPTRLGLRREILQTTATTRDFDPDCATPACTLELGIKAISVTQPLGEERPVTVAGTVGW